MTIEALTKLIELLRENGVTRFKDDVLDIRFDDKKLHVNSKLIIEKPYIDSKVTPSQAIPPVESEIPHHVNEVMGLLKLSDEELVEKMWPEPKNEAV